MYREAENQRGFPGQGLFHYDCSNLFASIVTISTTNCVAVSGNGWNQLLIKAYGGKCDLMQVGVQAALACALLTDRQHEIRQMFSKIVTS
jgi:hypothetical protein